MIHEFIAKKNWEHYRRLCDRRCLSSLLRLINSSTDRSYEGRWCWSRFEFLRSCKKSCTWSWYDLDPPDEPLIDLKQNINRYSFNQNNSWCYILLFRSEFLELAIRIVQSTNLVREKIHWCSQKVAKGCASVFDWPTWSQNTKLYTVRAPL